MEIDIQKLIKQITGNTGIGQSIVTKVINAIKELGIFDKISALTNNNLNLNNISNIINIKNIIGTLVSKTGEKSTNIPAYSFRHCHILTHSFSQYLAS